MEKLFTKIASRVAYVTGKPVAFLACLVVVVVWAVSGPIFGFSDTWQLVINTGTTIITFLMVFLIQNTQNRDGVALQAKLDELIRVSEAKNRFIGIEHLSETEVEDFRSKCEQAAKEADRLASDAGELEDEIEEAKGMGGKGAAHKKGRAAHSQRPAAEKLNGRAAA